MGRGGTDTDSALPKAELARFVASVIAAWPRPTSGLPASRQAV